MSVDSWQNLELLESIQKGVEYGRRIDDLRKAPVQFRFLAPGA